MPCQHSEDLCQRCLKKVEIDEPKISLPRKKKWRDKSNKILLQSALLAGVGYTAYYSGKFFLGVFDYGVSVAKDLLETILTRGE